MNAPRTVTRSLATLLGLVLVTAMPASGAEALGESFFAARCSRCHELSGLENLSPEEWVRRLQALEGGTAAVSGEPRDLLVVLQEHSRRAETMLSMADERRFFEKKCGECHSSARIFLVTLTPEQRRHVVRRMRERWEGGDAWISEEDAERVLAYVEQAIDEGVPPSRTEIENDPKQAFRNRCATCHSLDRVYQQVKKERDKASAWIHVVNRMRAKAPEWISEEEARQIVDYLQSRTYPKKQN